MILHIYTCKHTQTRTCACVRFCAMFIFLFLHHPLVESFGLCIRQGLYQWLLCQIVQAMHTDRYQDTRTQWHTTAHIFQEPAVPSFVNLYLGGPRNATIAKLRRYQKDQVISYTPTRWRYENELEKMKWSLMTGVGFTTDICLTCWLCLQSIKIYRTLCPEAYWPGVAVWFVSMIAGLTLFCLRYILFLIPECTLDLNSLFVSWR